MSMFQAGDVIFGPSMVACNVFRSRCYQYTTPFEASDDQLEDMCLVCLED